MTGVCDLRRGTSPLLISIPHDGRKLAPGMSGRLTGAALALPDTDWHVGQLYAFAHEIGASVVAAAYSRYVVDLNRASTDEPLYAGAHSTGLCPRKTFAGEDIYLDGQGYDADEVASRVREYWQPYHDCIRTELERIRKGFGYALLWDAHSIPGEVPMLFDGVLPDLNIGTNKGRSCHELIERRVAAVAQASPYSSVLNGRFTGGFITRHYGAPDERVHAIQLELAQRCYMDENSRAFDALLGKRLGATLTRLLEEFQRAANDLAEGKSDG